MSDKVRAVLQAGGSAAGAVVGVLITALILGAIGGFVFRKYQTKRCD